MMVIKYGLLLLAYLLGAIPFSIIFGKIFKGIDVRDFGSGNPGGTNSLRFLGKKVGVLVIIGDVTKGAIIIILMKMGVFGDVDNLFHPLAYGFVSALGHAFSIFIKFRGGKAVGTTVGAMSAFNPLLSLLSAPFFFFALKATKYVSIGSTFYAIGIIIIALVVQDYQMLLYVSLSAALIFYRHRTNYENIKNGTETKITWM